MAHTATTSVPAAAALARARDAIAGLADERLDLSGGVGGIEAGLAGIEAAAAATGLCCARDLERIRFAAARVRELHGDAGPDQARRLADAVNIMSWTIDRATVCLRAGSDHRGDSREASAA